MTLLHRPGESSDRRTVVGHGVPRLLIQALGLDGIPVLPRRGQTAMPAQWFSKQGLVYVQNVHCEIDGQSQPCGGAMCGKWICTMERQSSINPVRTLFFLHFLVQPA